MPQSNSNLKYGNVAVDTIYLGQQLVSRMYFGTTLIWDTTLDSGDTQTYTYNPTQDIIANPERGFFQYTETHYQIDASGHVPLSTANLVATKSSQGRSLVFRYYVIEKFRTLDIIDQAYLTLLANDLAAARAAGVKLIIRFTYSTAGTMTPPYSADAPVDRVVSHIGQLAPTLNSYADVIDSIQAGFIGMWGEWYYTDNYGDLGIITEQNWQDRNAVLNALLDYLDNRIFVLVRYPGIKERKFR